jgi:microsomal dipeptidase-like Zn-dependent dipeptidase
MWRAHAEACRTGRANLRDRFVQRHRLLALGTVALALGSASIPAADAVEPYKPGEAGSTSQPGPDSLGVEVPGSSSTSRCEPITTTSPSPHPVELADVPRTGPKVTVGYVMTHEHPTEGMAFGGNYAYAGSVGNYVNGIPERGYSESCGGCGTAGACDHAEFKGSFGQYLTARDVGDHPSQRGPYADSFTHLRYSTEWIEDAFRPAAPYADNRMRIIVAFAVESEAMCEQLYYVNVGKGGAGGDGYPCSRGDSIASLERQITNLKRWAAAHDEWMEIAYTAAQARDIVNRDKLAVVLGIEAEYAWGAEDRTFDPVERLARYYRDGVRTFYLAHKLNSRLAGADIYRSPDLKSGGAIIRATQAISGCFYYDDSVGSFPLIGPNAQGSPHNYCNNNCGDGQIKGANITDACNGRISEISEWNMVSYVLQGAGDFNGFAIYPKPPGFPDKTGGLHMDEQVERNNLSLSNEGSRVVLEAMRRGMIINLDHVSSKARKAIYDHSQDYYNYPVNALHNNPNEMLIDPEPNEYDFDRTERAWIKSSGGIFGVRLGPIDAQRYDRSGVTANCGKTATENAKVLACLIDEGSRVGYSLDFATITEGTYSRTKAGCSDLGMDHLDAFDGNKVTQGLGHIGNMRAWHEELETIGMKPRYVNELRNDTAEYFLRMWEKSEFVANMPATVMSVL